MRVDLPWTFYSLNFRNIKSYENIMGIQTIAQTVLFAHLSPVASTKHCKKPPMTSSTAAKPKTQMFWVISCRGIKNIIFYKVLCNYLGYLASFCDSVCLPKWWRAYRPFSLVIYLIHSNIVYLFRFWTDFHEIRRTGRTGVEHRGLLSWWLVTCDIYCPSHG